MSTPNPRNKRTRIIEITSTSETSKTKLMNNITSRPCSECGKKFRSWKALFGHMRCHPERQWRGINPPPNFRRHPPKPTNPTATEEDHELATCLLMLAGGPTGIPAPEQSPTINQGIFPEVSDSSGYAEESVVDGADMNIISCGYECSTCNEVLIGSTSQGQAITLATRKNNADGEKQIIDGCCGYSREKEASATISGLSPRVSCGTLDLNYPAVLVEDNASSLELRLGL